MHIFLYSLFVIRESRITNRAKMILKPQDVVILLKLVAIGKTDWSYASLSVDLFMSPSEVHAGIRRALAANLAVRNNAYVKPALRSLEEFVTHGLRYVYIPDRGGITRGIPTLHAGPPLSHMVAPSNEPPPVWPDPEGDVRGQSFSPLYKSVPKATMRDRRLYELLVLTDAVRGGRAREREIAIKEIFKRFRNYDGNQPEYSNDRGRR